MGRNNHLQINILKHILRMHKHDFCGEQSIYTRAILANYKICMHDFFCGGGGHQEFVGPPVATPLVMSQVNLAPFEAESKQIYPRWVQHFEPETKRHSMQWKRPSCPSPKKDKVVASVFWDAKGIVSSTTFRKAKYCQWGILCQLAETAAKGNQIKTAWENWWREFHFTQTMLLHTSLW